MNTVSVDLAQVLDFRDERARLQKAIQEKSQKPLISFTMNIAGPIKRSSLIDFTFNQSVMALIKKLGRPLNGQIIRRAAGNAAFLTYDISAEELKAICVLQEDAAPAGRLLDIDVLDEAGDKISRRSERCCLICGGLAAPCARSRKHTIDELKAKTDELLWKFARQEISRLAVKALLDEVRLTPKPGLVDATNSGAHRDMDIALMEKSAYTLGPFFDIAVELGYQSSADRLEMLQKAGIDAEKRMLEATNGVNTHRGAIFSLGLLCAGAGMMLSGCGASAADNAAALAAGLKSIRGETHGNAVRKKYSGAGAKEEALAGFPDAVAAASILACGGTAQEALLELLCHVYDTNLLWRGGEEGLRFVQNRARHILSASEILRDDLMREFDAECIRYNLSPGGSADLLAAGMFLFSLSSECVELCLSE